MIPRVEELTADGQLHSFRKRKALQPFEFREIPAREVLWAEPFGLFAVIHDMLQSGNPFTVTGTNHVAWPADQIRADRYCNGRTELANKNLRTNGMYWINAGTRFGTAMNRFVHGVIGGWSVNAIMINF
jgi:hypothetical protein